MGNNILDESSGSGDDGDGSSDESCDGVARQPMPQEFWFSIHVSEDMEKLNVNWFYIFGSVAKEHIGQLANENIPFSERMLSLYVLRTWFEVFVDRSSDTTWRATRDKAREIIGILRAPKVDDLGGELGQQFDSYYIRLILRLLQTFDVTFTSDNESSNVFSVSQKGTHSSLDLMQRAEDNLPPDVKARLSVETVRDIRDAGQCLALDCHTASGYHVLRAVERMIIKYLVKVSGAPVNPKNRNWGVYIRELKRLNADAGVTGYLQHIKDFYRNPIIHPEDTLNANEAFSLFNASVSAIIQLDAAIEAWP